MGVMTMHSNKANLSQPIDRVRKLLDDNKTNYALMFIERLGDKSIVMQNARGVCLMRLGKFKEALSVLRDVAFQGYPCLPPDTPVLYQINFAVAMLGSNHKEGAFSILNKLEENEHPQIAKLKDAIRRWVKGLNFVEKCCYYVGLYPNKPVVIDFLPGDI
jgi:hypothetical protein